MAKKYFAQDVKSSSDYISKVKNIEMMKGAKSKNPTLNYRLKDNEFIQFWNYDIYLSLVKAYTSMKIVVCDDCKYKSQPPSSIIDGITSYQCFDELEEIIKNCHFCKDLVLYPYGKFKTQMEECFKFPRKITNDPCEKSFRQRPYIPKPKEPCKPHKPRPLDRMSYCKTNRKGLMRPCDKSNGCGCSHTHEDNSEETIYETNGTMRPCCLKQTKPRNCQCTEISDDQTVDSQDVKNSDNV